MTIQVTGCHDCPLCDGTNLCGINRMFVWPNFVSNTMNKDCPLQTEPITIKKKQDDTTGKS